MSTPLELVDTALERFLGSVILARLKERLETPELTLEAVIALAWESATGQALTLPPEDLGAGCLRFDTSERGWLFVYTRCVPVIAKKQGLMATERAGLEAVTEAARLFLARQAGCEEESEGQDG